MYFEMRTRKILKRINLRAEFLCFILIDEILHLISLHEAFGLTLISAFISTASIKESGIKYVLWNFGYVKHIN